MNVPSILDAVRPYTAAAMARPVATAFGAGKSMLRGAFGLPGIAYSVNDAMSSDPFLRPAGQPLEGQFRTSFDRPEFNQPQMANGMNAYIAKMRQAGGLPPNVAPPQPQSAPPAPQPAPGPPMNIVPPAANTAPSGPTPPPTQVGGLGDFLNGVGGYIRGGTNPNLPTGEANPYYTSGLSNNELASKVLKMFG